MRAVLVPVALGLAGAGAVGCGLFEGLRDQAELISPPAKALHFPGVRVAGGKFERITFLTDEDDGFRFAAVRSSGEERRLHLFRAKWEGLSSLREDAGGRPDVEANSEVLAQCDGGAVTDFAVYFHPSVGEQPSHYEVRGFSDEDGDGRGTLRFLDLDCAELAEPLDDVDWEGRVACVHGEEHRCISVLRGGGDLYRLGPERDGAELFASDASDFVVVERFAYTTEGDLVVQRDLLEELPETSKELPGATFERPTHRGRYQSASIRTPNGLWVWPTNVRDPLRVAEDGCGFVGGTLNRAYLAPCEGGRLTMDVWSLSGRRSLEFDVGDRRPGEIAVIDHEDGTNTALVWLASLGADPSDLGTVGTLLGTEWRDDAEEIPPLQLVDDRARFMTSYRRGGLVGWRVGQRCSEERCDEYASRSENRLDLATLRGRPTKGATDFRPILQHDGDETGSVVEAVFGVDGTLRIESREWEEGRVVAETTTPVTDGVLGYRFHPLDPWPREILQFRTDLYGSGRPDFVGFVRNPGGGAAGDLHLLESASLRMTAALASDVVPSSMEGLTTPPAVFFRSSKAATELHVVFVDSELEETVPNVGAFLSGHEFFPGLLYATTGEGAALWYAPPKY